MLGFQVSITVDIWSAVVIPPAPSPDTASVKDWPAGGVVPSLGVNVLLLTGGCVIPLRNVSEMEARWEVNPSFISASSSSRRVPSTHFVVGRLRLKGVWKSVRRYSPPR